MPFVPIETLIFGHPKRRTTYSQRQLRDKLAILRAGVANALPDGTALAFTGGVRLTKAQVLGAIDSELATFAAFDALLINVKSQRETLAGRLPLLATAIESLSVSLRTFAGPSQVRRQSFGLAPGKKPRKLKPEERLAATEKLRATRKRNGTASKKPRRR